MEGKVDNYKVQYRVKGIGLTLEEMVPARSNFEAQKIVESRYDRDKLYVVVVVKQPPQGRT
jgi:hypothetical protein